MLSDDEKPGVQVVDKKIYEEAKNKAYEAKLQREKELQEANAKTSKAKTEYDTASTSYDDSVNDMHANASTQKAIFDCYAERSGVAHDNASAASENAKNTKADQNKKVSDALSSESESSTIYATKVSNYSSAQTASTIVYNENITLENRTGQAYDNARKYWIDLEEYYSANPLMASGGEIYYKMIDTAKRQRFYAVMKNNFGFDYEVAKIMYDLYAGIEDTTAWMEEDYNSYWISDNSIIKVRTMEFVNIVAAAYYGQFNPDSKVLSKEYLKDLAIAETWKHVAGIDINEFNNDVMKYKISKDDSLKLFNALNENHDIADKYHLVDITHLMIIIALYLKDDDLVNPASWGVRHLNSECDEITFGFAGDIFGVYAALTTLEPSIGAGDYTSDLDAVNIARIFMTSKNLTIIDILIQYYEGIENNSINRANDFLINMGGKKAFEKFFEVEDKRRNRKNELAMKFKDNVLAGKQTWE